MIISMTLLKGSWDLVSRVIIRVTILITPIKGLVTLLTKSHDPPSRVLQLLNSQFVFRLPPTASAYHNHQHRHHRHHHNDHHAPMPAL